MAKKPKKSAYGSEEEKRPKEIPQPNARKWLMARRRSLKIKKPFLDDADRFLKMYQGDYTNYSAKRKRNYEMVSVNFVYAHIETITPSVFSGFPYIKVRPKPKAGESTKDAEIRARNMELVINYWFKELNVDEELADVFFDTFFGPAIAELGWETKIEERFPIQEEADGAEVPKPEVIKIIDKPYIQRREFKSFYMDPDARRRKDARWMGVDEIMKWNDFLADPRFSEKCKGKLKPQYYPVDKEEQRDYFEREEDRSEKEWICISHFWDKDTRKVYSVAEGYDKFLNGEGEGVDWPFEIDYKSDPYPFCVHDGKRDRCSPYTWSEFKAGEPQILEMNRIRAAIGIHVKKSIPKYVYTDQAGTRTDINKLANAKTDEFTKLNSIDESAIRAFQGAEIPKPLFEFNSMSRDDLTHVMGTAQFENNSFADTATEAQINEGRSQARKSMRSKQWEQYVVEIAAKLSQLCQQNMSEALAVEIAGPNGIEWLRVSREEIKGEFYFDIEPGIMEYKNEALRKQQLLKFYEISINNPNSNQRGILLKIAQEFDMDPAEVIIPEAEMPSPEPPEPSIQFKDIDPATITDPRVKNSVVIAALKQNGVVMNDELEAHLMGLPPPEPQNAPGAPIGPQLQGMEGLPSSGGKDAATAAYSPNGNPGLPPVTGNIREFQ